MTRRTRHWWVQELGSRRLAPAGQYIQKDSLLLSGLWLSRSKQLRISLTFDSTEPEVIRWIKFWSYLLLICHPLLGGLETLEVHTGYHDTAGASLSSRGLESARAAHTSV